MKIRTSRLLAMLLASLMIFVQPLQAGAIEDRASVLTDEVVLSDSFESLQLDVYSYEGTSGGTGSIYSTLNARQKNIYNALLNVSWSQIISSKDYQVRVNISGITGTTLTGMKVGDYFQAIGASVPVYNSIRTDVNAAIAALRYDRPDLLWLDRGVGGLFQFRGADRRYTLSDFYFTFSLAYNGQENTMRERMMAEARRIAEEASREPDMYSKVKKAHDMLAVRSTYNRYPPDDMSSWLSHSAYSAIIGGDEYEPVCDGYSKAFKIVLNLMDIPCAVPVSNDHMWNNVKMDDGLWYNVDLTWDDGYFGPTTDYFLVGSETSIYGSTFASSHKEYDPFNVTVISGARYPQKSAKAYVYIGEDYPKPIYTDVFRDNYAYSHIETVSKLGYFSGDGSGRFYPENQIKRAEFAQVVASVLGVNCSQYKGMYSFPDVSTGAWYSGVAYWAKDSGIMVGSNGMFRPNDPISRQEMCSVLTRAFGLERGSTGVFPDDGSIAGWAKEGVYACRSAGLVNGFEDGNFYPGRTTLRRNAAVVFSKYAEMMGIVPSGGQ